MLLSTRQKFLTVHSEEREARLEERFDSQSAKQGFWLFITVHLFAWAFMPAIVRNNLPLDSIEGTIWGHNLQWGYDKNPYLNGWLTALAVFLDGGKDWLIYFFSQISVIACFLSVWALAKRMLPPAYALFSVMLLEGIQYYHFHAIDFNDNTLELGLFGLTIYFFYRAMRDHPEKRLQHALNWIAAGLFAGLSMMSKYYTASLLAAMTCFILTHPSCRKQLLTPAPYLGLTIFLIIIAPHLIWLPYHDFMTVTYVFDRARNPPAFINHLKNPLQFAWQQFEVFLPAFLIGLSLLIKNKRENQLKLDIFDRDFLYYVGLGPFILTLLLSLLFGIKLRAGWGMPLQSLWGIILIASLKPVITGKRIYLFFITIYSLICLLLTGYIISLIYSADQSSANFPGKQIANTITQQWHDAFHTPLAYVAGSRWVGGNIEFYSKDHPSVFIEWNTRHAPWINLEDLHKKGGIFIWDLTEKEKMPEVVKRQFKTLQKPVIYEFDWHRNVSHLPPSRIAVAMLPPAEKK